MLSKLPDVIQQEVMHLLENNNFRGAKAIYDEWKNKLEQQANYNNKQYEQSLCLKKLPITTEEKKLCQVSDLIVHEANER